MVVEVVVGVMVLLKMVMVEVVGVVVTVVLFCSSSVG